MFLLCLSKEELKKIENQVILAFWKLFLLEGFDSVSSDDTLSNALLLPVQQHPQILRNGL